MCQSEEKTDAARGFGYAQRRWKSGSACAERQVRAGSRRFTQGGLVTDQGFVERLHGFLETLQAIMRCGTNWQKDGKK